MEALEPRQLFAGAAAELLAALPPMTASVNVVFDQAVEAGGALFLTGHRNEEPETLYATAGGGGSPAALFTASTYSSSHLNGVTAPTPFAGKLYFFGSRVVNGQPQDGLFASDGTPAGTVVVKALSTGTHVGLSNQAFVLGGKLHFFHAVGGTTQLWSSDGTAAGTQPVWTAPAGTYVQTVSPVVDGRVLFGAAGKLWRTDGTAAGTAAVWTAPSENDLPIAFTPAGSKLFFLNQVYNGPRQLFVAARDGSGATPVPLPTDGSSFTAYVSGGLVAAGDRVLFTSSHPQAVYPRLYASDGTAAGTVRLAGGSGYEMSDLVAAAGGRAAFLQRGPAGTSGLWVTDGTPAGTRLAVARPNLDVLNTDLFAAAGRAFMRDPTLVGARLYTTDGTTAGTRPVHYFPPGDDFAGRKGIYLTTFGTRLVAQGFEGGAAQVWALDPDVPAGSVAGAAYVDETRDGRRQGFEPPLPGTPYLDLNGTGALDAGDVSPVADTNGPYTIDGLVAGGYTVRLARTGSAAGLPLAVPAGGAHAVALQPGQAVGGLDFVTPGTSTLVWGTVFDDADADGTRAPSEGAPAAAQRVYLDLNGNRLYDPASEPGALTAADGTYGIVGPAAGTYTVRRDTQAGWRQTTPTARGGVTVTVAAGQPAEAAAIGVAAAAPGSVAGRVWLDADLDGVRDAGEAPQAGVQVTLLDEYNRTTTATTDQTGRYAFPTLIADAPYRVRFARPLGHSLTARGRGADRATDSDADQQTAESAVFAVAPGQPAADVDAGLIPSTAVAGTVYREVNENGRRDANEPGLAGFTAFLDADADGQLDPGEASTVTSATGAYTLYTSPGPTRAGVVLPAGWVAADAPAARNATAVLGNNVIINPGLAPAAGPTRHAGPVGTEFRLNQTTDGSQSQPAVAADAAGNVLAAWYAGSQVVARRFDPAGVPLGDEFTVSTPDAPASGYPKVAALAGGGFVAVWLGSGKVYARRLAADATPAGPAFAVDQTAGSRADVRLAADPTGGFAVAYSGTVPGDTDGVAARRYDAAGNPKGNEFRVNDYSNSPQAVANLAFDATGRLTVAYTSSGQSGSGGAVYARRFGADGAAGSAGFRVNAADVPAVAAAVAVDAAGRVAFLWVSNGDVFARTYGPDLQPLTGDVRVDSSSSAAVTPGSLGSPQLVAGTDGMFLAAWASTPQDGSGNGAYAQLLGPDGLPHGREFRLNTTTTGAQQWPNLAAGPGGTYLAAWTSAGQDGSLDGVYAQRLATFADRSSIAGRAWTDTDADGVREAGEFGLANVTAELYTAAGAIVDVAQTGVDGTYRFAAVRAGEAYRVRFVTPANRFVGPADVGTDDGVDSDADPSTGSTAAITAAVAGGTVAGVDVSIVSGATVSGTLYYDADGNGSRAAAGEPGLAGWTVFLDADADGVLDSGERPATTGATGGYAFTTLPAGTYRVGVVPFTRWAPSTPTAAATVAVATGQAATVDVGARSLAATDTRAAPIGVEHRVNTTTAGNQVAPAVAADAAGNYVVVWTNGTGLAGQRYAAGGAAVGGEFVVAAIGAAPSVATAADGRFVVAWQDAGEVYARRYDAAGAPAGAPWQVNTTTADAQVAPDVAAEPDGDFVVVWQSANQDGDGQGVYAQRYAADGTPRGGEFRATGTAAANQTGPAVGVDAGGDIVVTYLSGTLGVNVYAYVQRFDAAGQAVGGEVRVVPPPSGSGYEWVDVAVNAGGEFVVAVRGFDPGGHGIEARRFAADGTPQGPAFVANTNTPGSQDAPAVAIADDGRFVVAWNTYGESAEANSSGVRAQLFAASGVKLGQELRVNTTIPFSQYSAAVALQPDGFVVGWVSQNQDGDDTGVYAQRYTTFGSSAAIGGVAFVDANNNNVRDPGEAGRDGVAVRLVDADGTTVASTTTAGGGRYRFDDLRPGAAYRVGFAAAPATAFSTVADAGADDAADSDADPATGLTTPITVAAGQADLTRDAGLVPLATVSGTMFNDADADGVRDAGEAPLVGWVAFLDADGDATLDAGERTATSAADGSYVFADLRPGPYRVEVVAQQRWDPTTPITSRMPVLAPGQAYALDLGAVPTAAPVLVAAAGAATVADPATRWEFENRGDRLAVDAQGNFVTVGITYRSAPNEYDVLARRHDAAGNPVGATFTVHATTFGSQLDPAIAGRPDGGFVVVWEGSPNSTLQTDVYARVYGADGLPVGGDVLVNQVTAGRQATPSVAVEPDGDFVVAWEGEDGSGTGVYARRFAAGGAAAGDEFRVNPVTAGDQTEPDVATNAAGQVAVIWHDQRDGGAKTVYGRRYAAPGAAAGEVQISTTRGNHQQNASIAMNAGGETAVVWQGPGTGGWTVFLSRYDGAGIRQAGEVVVNTTAGAEYPHAAIGDDGRVVVAWEAPDGDETGVFVRRYTGAGLPAGDPARVNADVTGRQESAVVAARADGGDLVSWVYNGSHGGGGRLQRFDPVARPPRATAGGFVWADDGRDGVFDAGDAPRAGVRVELLDEAGAVVDSAVTAANGAFRFDAVRPGSAYTFRYAVPAGRAVTARDQGSDDARDSDVDPATAGTPFVAPAAGRVDLTYGLGLAARAATPAVVGSVAVTAGPPAQRSMVTGISVTFDQPVIPDPGAFVLTGHGGVAVGVVVSATNPSADGLTWELTFAGPTVSGGSLPDGLYTMSVSAAKVRAGSPAGPAMTADHVFGFHRLFADADGDRDVDGGDSRGFRGALGSEVGMPAYNPTFDYDADGDVDGADSRAFRRRLGTEI